ncbi:hypothetical protein [Kordia sp.]|uniref:hypothetical protein n=1 Tax=Kordia sp. TaxID=1965332 RepID=UPI003D6B0800
MSISSLTRAQTIMHPETLIPQPYYYHSFLYGEPIRGDIKKVATKNYTYVFNEIDSTYIEYEKSNFEEDVFVALGEVNEYHQNGQLLNRGFINKDGAITSTTQNTYNEKGSLIYTIEPTKIYDKETRKLLRIHKEEEKRTYTDVGKLKEVWLKSSYQDDYFIKEKYTYVNDTLLSKYESFNSNTLTQYRISCKGGMVDTDYVRLYSYDKKDRLIAEKTYAYEYDFDENNIKAITDRDFSKYKLSKIVAYKYNDTNQVVEKVQKHFGTYTKGIVNTDILEYDAKNRLVQHISTENKGHGDLRTYEYDLKSGKLSKTVNFTIQIKDSQIISQELLSIVEKQQKGFRAQHFKNDKVVSVAFYSEYGDQLHIQDFDYKSESSYQYSYDKHGNWTSRILLENGIKKEKITRTLEYYSE